jgi:hypothetical protein
MLEQVSLRTNQVHISMSEVVCQKLLPTRGLDSKIGTAGNTEEV